MNRNTRRLMETERNRTGFTFRVNLPGGKQPICKKKKNELVMKRKKEGDALTAEHTGGFWVGVHVLLRCLHRSGRLARTYLRITRTMSEKGGALKVSAGGLGEGVKPSSSRAGYPPIALAGVCRLGKKKRERTR